MAISVPATREALANAYSALGAYISLHTGDPGTTGANEATGGSPAYARKQTTWATGDASDGVETGSQVTFDVPAGTYTHVGIWSATTGGTFIDSYKIPGTPNDAGIVLSIQGQVRVTPTYTQS